VVDVARSGPTALDLPRAARLTRLRAEVLVATWLCYAGFYVTRKVFGIVKAPLKERLGVDDLGVSHLWTTYLVAYMLGQFLAAAAGRRWSSRSLLLAGMAVSIAASAGTGFLLNAGPRAYVPVMVLLAVQGLAQATGWPHTVGIVARWTPRRARGTTMSLWATCYQLGAAAAKALGAFFFGWVGLVGAFQGSALVLALILALFVVFGHDRPEAKGLELLDDDAEAIAPTDAGPARPRVAFLPAAISMGLIYFGFKFIRYALDSWSALILREHFALGTELAGYYSTAFDWLGFVGVLASGPISDRFFGGRRAPLIFLMSIGCLLSTALLGAAGLSSPFAFTALLGLVGFMAMGPDVLLSGPGAMDLGNAERAALAAGIINGLGSIGPIVQEPLIGWLKTTAGLGSVFGLLALVAFLASAGSGAFWWTMSKKGASL
jgi:sugar phosphate permease